MEVTSLLLASILLLLPLYISHKEKLYLEKDIIISIVRAIVQLVIVGYLLEFVFGLENGIFTIGLVFVLIVNASLNTRSKAGEIRHVVAISFLSMAVGTFVTMFVLIAAKAISFTANEVVPVAGMVVSNSMIAIGLSYRNMNQVFRHRRVEVEVKLSLGAQMKEASMDILRESIKLAIMPTIDSAKTLGIVSLPGMMTGLILGGASPIVAIKFQIMVTIMILSSSSIATLLATYLGYRSFFNHRKQLL